MQTRLYRIYVSFGGATFSRGTEKGAIYISLIANESAVSLGNER